MYKRAPGWEFEHIRIVTKDLLRWGNRNSRPWETKESRVREDSLDISPDSPLGRMLRFWGDNSRTRDKEKQKLVKYCFIWTKDPITNPSVLWLTFAWGANWVCQTSVMYVNEKTSSTHEEKCCAL